MKNITVGQLIELLKGFDKNLPIVSYRDGKGHDFGITSDMVKVKESAYFGNDLLMGKEWPSYDEEKDEDTGQKYVQIAVN